MEAVAWLTKRAHRVAPWPPLRSERVFIPLTARFGRVIRTFALGKRTLTHGPPFLSPSLYRRTHTHTHPYVHAYIAFFLLLSRIMSVPLKRDARQTNRSWNVRFNERAIRFARLRRNLGEPRDFYIIYLVVLIYQLVEEFSVETNFNV